MQRNITLYYILSLFNSCWFQLGNWGIFVLMYINASELGLYEFLAFGLGFLLEIPSGALADMLGRRTTIIVGNFFMALGAILFIFAGVDKYFILIGNILLVGIAFPMISGSFEALAYDSLKQDGKANLYPIVAQNVARIHIITFIVVSIVGGLMWKVSMYLPWILTGLSFLMSFIISFWLKEPTIDSEKFSLDNFIFQNKIGFKMFAKGLLRVYIPVFMILYGIYYMWSTGMIRVVMGNVLGFDGENINYLMALAYFISALILGTTSCIRKFLKDSVGFILLAVLIGMGYLFAYFSNNMIGGALAFILIMASGTLTRPWVSMLINENIESKYRATTISTFSFLVQIPYILIVIPFGWLTDKGLTREFYLWTGIFIILLTGYAGYRFYKYRAELRLKV